MSLNENNKMYATHFGALCVMLLRVCKDKSNRVKAVYSGHHG